MKNFFLSIAFCSLAGGTMAADYWQKIAVPSSKHLLSVSFGSASVGYISGSDSSLLKTTNGGKTWTSIKPTGMSFTLYAHDITDVRFITDNIGYAIVGNYSNPVYNGVLYKTMDGGATWTQSYPDITCQALFFFDENNGFVAGSKFFSGRNVNKLSAGVWQTPHYFSLNPVEQFHAIDFYNTNVGIVGGDSGYVYRTFNGGISWDTVRTNIDTSIKDIKYLDENTLIAATNNFGSSILISKDKGLTWNYDASSATFYYPYFKAIARSAKDSLIFVGTSITTGKGIVFYFEKSVMTIFPTDENLNHVSLSNDSTAFIVGDNGLVLSNKIEGTGILESGLKESPINIYPNPSAAIFNISATFEHRIVVYDCLGKPVATDAHFAFKHSLDLSEKARGVYLLEIVSKEGIHTKTTLIIK